MENSFATLIESAKSTLVLLPTKPTFDQVAAALSLYISLSEKVESSISCPTPIMVGFNRLVGVDKITQEVGNKNLTIRFAGYDATKIEKVSYDIENGEFKLTVVPKPGESSPDKSQLDLSYKGAACDLVILIGGANDSHFPLLTTEEIRGVKVLHVGTRVLNSSHEVMSFAKPGASVSELVTILIKESGLNLDRDIATNLVAGIEEGSSGFTTNEVTPETFETFAFLLRNGGERMPKNKLTPAHFPPGAIPTTPFTRPQPIQQVMPTQMPASFDEDLDGTQEEEQDINPPEDWLQPKVFKGANTNQPNSFNENKG